MAEQVSTSYTARPMAFQTYSPWPFEPAADGLLKILPMAFRKSPMRGAKEAEILTARSSPRPGLPSFARAGLH